VINPLTFDWDATVEPAERDRLLNNIADTVVIRGLQAPVSWLLEIHRPLMSVASQFGITLSPFLASLFPGGPVEMQKYTKLLQDRQNLDLLISLIEAKTLEGQVAAR
jgi:hypothetical protein